MLTGELKTLTDNAFDFERLEEVIFQVMASDTLQALDDPEPLHTTFTQVTIQVIDVNNKPPTLRMVRLRLTLKDL